MTKQEQWDRVKRILARVKEGASFAAIGAEEGVSRQRVRQIVVTAPFPNIRQWLAFCQRGCREPC
jgi:DNA-directed RNA polymerase sigma subunit (sigma70/sigma32)